MRSIRLSPACGTVAPVCRDCPEKSRGVMPSLQLNSRSWLQPSSKDSVMLVSSSLHDVLPWPPACQQEWGNPSSGWKLKPQRHLKVGSRLYRLGHSPWPVVCLHLLAPTPGAISPKWWVPISEVPGRRRSCSARHPNKEPADHATSSQGQFYMSTCIHNGGENIGQ